MGIFKYLYEGILIWFIIAFLGSIAYVGLAYFQSLQMLQKDPSAMAWFGFLPFIYPIFLMYSTVITLAVMFVYKIIYYLAFVLGK